MKRLQLPSLFMVALFFLSTIFSSLVVQAKNPFIWDENGKCQKLSPINNQMTLVDNDFCRQALGSTIIKINDGSCVEISTNLKILQRFTANKCQSLIEKNVLTGLDGKCREYGPKGEFLKLVDKNICTNVITQHISSFECLKDQSASTSQQILEHRSPNPLDMAPKVFPQMSARLKIMEELALLQDINRSKDKIPTTKAQTQKSLDPQDIYYIDSKNLQDHQSLPSFFDEDALEKSLKSGLVKIEDVPAGQMVKFLYNRGIFGSIIRGIGSKKFLTKMYGMYNDSNANEISILNFIRKILKIDINSQNFLKVQQDFKQLYGRGIDEFSTINEIFARKLTDESVQNLLRKMDVKEGDIISNSTARLRIIPNVKVHDSFHLTDKSIGGQKNQFSVQRLFGNTKDEKEISAEIKSKLVKKMENLQLKIKNLKHDREKAKQSSGKTAAIDSKLTEAKEEVTKLTDPILLNLLSNYVQGSTMMVNRLAPEDYHHIHFPFSQGTILGRSQLAQGLKETSEDPQIHSHLKELYQQASKVLEQSADLENADSPYIHIDGDLLSVSTMATTSEDMKFNPLTENLRDLVFIDAPGVGIVPMVIIGATGVGKNVINLKAGQKLMAGDNMAHFEFGASTTIMFLPKDKVVPLERTKKMMDLHFTVPLTEKQKAANLAARKNGNSTLPHPPITRNMETLVEMGEPLFKVAQ